MSSPKGVQNNHMAASVKVGRQQTPPELSGTFRNLPEPTFRNLPEPASGTYTSTHRNSPEPSGTASRNLHQHTPELSGTCSCDPHRHTPELFWAEDPISSRCWGKTWIQKPSLETLNGSYYSIETPCWKKKTIFDTPRSLPPPVGIFLETLNRWGRYLLTRQNGPYHVAFQFFGTQEAHFPRISWVWLISMLIHIHFHSPFLCLDLQLLRWHKPHEKQKRTVGHHTNVQTSGFAPTKKNESKHIGVLKLLFFCRSEHFRTTGSISFEKNITITTQEKSGLFGTCLGPTRLGVDIG